MQYHSNLENLDEDGYTQLDFKSRDISRRPVILKKGTCAPSPSWRLIAGILGILCLTILVIAVVLSTTFVSGPCPPNWIIHEESCYLFRKTLDSWDRSKGYCSQVGSRLVKIDNSKELKFISHRASSDPDHSYWIGLSRIQTDAPWIWEDGSMLISNLFTIRSTGNQESSPHNCAWIHESIIYDQVCSVSSYSICEKELVK
ncbi:C-type lectin domain family 7 member A [Rhynchocyon petersi]